MYSEIFSELMSVYGDLFSSIPTSSLIMITVSSLLGILYQILITVAIAKDCDAKGIKNKTAWCVLSFLFSTIVPIIYACCRSSAKKKLARLCLTCNTVVTEPMYDLCPNCNSFALQPIPPEDAQKKEKSSKIICVIAIVCYVIGWVLSTISSTTVLNSMVEWIDTYMADAGYYEEYDEYYDSYDLHYGYEVDGVYVYYDMKGNVYNDAEDVLFYDRMGNTYEYEDDEDYYLGYKFEDQNGVEYDSYDAYVDSDGYFYYDSESMIMIDDDFNYCDDQGNLYYDPFEVSWNVDGAMVDFDGELIYSTVY